MNIDKILFEKMFAYAQKNRRFGSAAVSLTKASSKIFFVIYAVVLYSLLCRTDKLIPALVVPFLALVTSLALRKLLKRPRPNAASGKTGYSFPSNHSASAAAIACACVYCQSGFAYAAVQFAVITGLSRVFAGLHYPSDVAAGWLLGCAFGCLFLFF